VALVAGGVVHWRTFLEAKRGHSPPPTQLKFTQYHLVFISFDHVKYKIFQISPLNFYVMTFSPSYNDGQGPPLASWVYRTRVFLLVCVLFRLTRELEILHFKGTWRQYFIYFIIFLIIPCSCLVLIFIILFLILTNCYLYFYPSRPWSHCFKKFRAAHSR
jgi:hypothetical protein